MSSTSNTYIEKFDGNWKNIQIDNAEYVIRIIEKNDQWKIYLTNIVDIWTESLDRSGILQKCEKLNPSLSIDDIDVVQLTRRLLNDIVKNITKSSVQRIELADELEGGIFKFSIDFTKGSSQQLWEEVTMPLCLVAGELQRRQAILLDLVKKKDEEILEYQLNGGQLTRKYIQTTKFNEELFKQDVPKLSAQSTSNAFATVMKLQEEIELDKFIIKTEPMEPCSRRTSDTEENLTRIDGKIEPEAVDNNPVTDTEISNDSKVETKSNIEASPHLAKKSKSLSISEGRKGIERGARSSSALPVKRSKKTINDFIS